MSGSSAAPSPFPGRRAPARRVIRCNVHLFHSARKKAATPVNDTDMSKTSVTAALEELLDELADDCLRTFRHIAELRRRLHEIPEGPEEPPETSSFSRKPMRGA